MKAIAFLALSLPAVLEFDALAQIPVLKRSDVVFMYQTDRQTCQDYGGTVLAWGGRPTPQSLEAAIGIKFFASVGMVTEFGRYYERFPQTYEQGLCRDLQGQPFKVPWLTDHQHKGVPFWWCCTRQPLFRQYISERVADTVKAGADGVHIDDHLGTAGNLWTGGCYCDRCVAEFGPYLAALPKDELARLGVQDPAAFNYRDVLREWLAQHPGRKVQDHPLWARWRVYQLRGAADFMAELRALAAKMAGHAVPMSANAGLLWESHLSDYQSLDFFSAEILHFAVQRRFSDSPMLAYRLADAVGRPLAATASGEDWAFVKEQNLPGLVQGWIALSYAAGHYLMVPHRQWCYTPQKGTHWYNGPKDKFAPLFQFVRQNAALFDGYENHADLTVAFSHRTYDRNMPKVKDVCNWLAAANLSYQIALGGDDIVDHPLPAQAVRQSRHLLVLERKDFSAADQQLLASVKPAQRLASVEDALAKLRPAVQLESAARLRVLPRVKRGSAVIHLVNWDYDPGSDATRPIKDLRLKLDLQALGVARARTVELFAPGAQPRPLSLQDQTVTVPELGLWAVLRLGKR